MRFAVVADIHSNLEAFQAVLEEIDRIGVDQIFSLGDIVGYNANPNECVDIIRERGVLSVLGNHDAAICGLEDAWFFRAAARRAVDWTQERLRDEHKEFLKELPEEMSFDSVYLGVHGSPTSKDDYIIDWLDAMRQLEYLEGRSIDICFFGHSHRPAIFSEKGSNHSLDTAKVHTLGLDNRYFINPGAVGQPRDKDWRAAFCIVDSERMTVELHRVPYDIDTCCEKLREAGLPHELARRLRKGK
jgi:diadenosine tetraphosphatase ApaH/serine/threonine PP2A family protein phosphatase